MISFGNGLVGVGIVALLWVVFLALDRIRKEP